MIYMKCQCIMVCDNIKQMIMITIILLCTMILYCIIGCSNHLKTLDGTIWTVAMLNEAEHAPAFFSEEFFHDCYNLVMQHFGWDIHRDINVSNALEVYMFLTDNV